jgi:NAD(P)-dependent dehydrogenase (short-subunit alcohol dehydrogenase family)
MGKLDGRVAIVTGGGTGIGKGITKAFAQEGCCVVIAARNAGRLEQAARELSGLPGEVAAMPADVTDEAAVQRLFDDALARFGRLDILVNNAGIVEGGHLDELTLGSFRRVLEVNVVGPFLCTRAAFRIMKKQGGGRIINIGSIAATRPRQQSAPYTASKCAVWGLTMCTALEGRDLGISCGQIDPGNTAVERVVSRDGRTLLGRDGTIEPLMPVDNIANAVLYMASLPPDATALQMIVMPIKQRYVGRG